MSQQQEQQQHTLFQQTTTTTKRKIEHRDEEGNLLEEEVDERTHTTTKRPHIEEESKDDNDENRLVQLEQQHHKQQRAHNRADIVVLDDDENDTHADHATRTRKCANDAGDDITAEEKARSYNILPAHRNVVNFDKRSCEERNGMPVGDLAQLIIDSHRKCPEFVNPEVCDKMERAMKYDCLHSLVKQYSTIVPMLKHIDIDAICAERTKKQREQEQQHEREELQQH